MINEEPESVQPSLSGQFRWTCVREDCPDRLIIAYSKQTLDTRVDLHIQAHLRQRGQLIQNPNVLTLSAYDIKFLGIIQITPA